MHQATESSRLDAIAAEWWHHVPGEALDDDSIVLAFRDRLERDRLAIGRRRAAFGTLDSDATGLSLYGKDGRSRARLAAAATRNARRVGILAALVASLVFTTDGLAHPVRCQKARAGSTIFHKGSVGFLAMPLRARAGSLRRENAAATRDDLSRVASGRMLTRFRRARLVVSVPVSTRTYYVSGVPGFLRVARPWTKRFIEQLAAAKRRAFGTPLRITGLTRTRSYQTALGTTNGNAAPAHGHSQSTHLTGAAVDISKRLLSTREIHWMRAVLRRLTADGLVHAIEEFRQPHFHVLVRKRYGVSARTLESPLLIEGC